MRTRINLPELTDSILGWLDKVESRSGGTVGRWKYNAGMYRDWAVESSGAAVILLESMGYLSRWTPEHKQTVIAEFQSWQEPGTGWFKDPLIRSEDKVSEELTWEHIWHHHTGICASALACLGGAAAYDLPQKAFFELTEDTVCECVSKLDWSNPWEAGEHWSRMMESYLAANRIDSSSQIDEVAARGYEVLESEVLNPETGLPDRKGPVARHVATAGLFKIMSAYLRISRPIPYAERALDSVLAMQTESGSFGADDMCIHWDSAWVLKNLNRQLEGEYRFDQIRRAGLLLSELLLGTHRKRDGGFSFYADHCLTTHNSIRISDPLPESDMLGTFMVLECLRYASGWAEGLIEIPSPVELRLRSGR